MARAEKIVLFVALTVCCLHTHAFDFEVINTTDRPDYVAVRNKNGEKVYMTQELFKKLDEELETWHWTPWLRTRTEVLDDVVKEVSCYSDNTLESFPDSIFTDDVLRRGAFLLYVMFGIYSFTLLAIVCNDYFIPCVEFICEDLRIPQNVAAATFMSVATSFPEFFVNVISTFLTESDMGIGTIVGSAIFNALGVAAIGGLAAVKPIPIEMRPVTRDVIIYMINVSILVVIVWDGQVAWYEATVLGIMYVLYFIFMFNSVRLFRFVDRIWAKCNRKRGIDISEPTSEENKPNVGIDNNGFDNVTILNGLSDLEKAIITDKVELEEKPKTSLWRFPKEKPIVNKLWWLYTWPLKLVLGLTIPSTVTCKRFYPVAFIMCIVWIGVNSYFVSWSMTIIGNTFAIPDSVMGMTFLAFGGCIPEACSIYIMSRRGEGGIGVSNALGANSLAILFALGLPWLIRTLSLVAQGAENPVVLINSAGIDFVVGSILVAVACLWIVLFIGKFELKKSIGFVLIILYVIFITFAILVEIGIILERAFAMCV